jgi:crotonobetainyl-CoA:carnitine CoA-transferase CaiB-like acyl-CoA transferase
MKMNPSQQSVYDEVSASLGLKFNGKNTVELVNSPANIVSPMPVNDVASAIFAVLGMTASTLAAKRGIQPQQMTIDRRHAGNILNGVAWHFQNYWQLDIHIVHTDINGFFQTADDRLVIYNGAYPGLRKIILDFLGCSNHRPSIAAATKKYNAEELEQELSNKGACIAMARTQQEWADHPQGQALAATPVIELIKLRDSGPLPLHNATRPLSNIKVLDLTKVIAGPTAGRVLAEHGAEVLHIRHPYEDLIYPFDIETSYGKINSYLDYSRPDQASQLHKLVKDADVFLQGYRYGALADAGFSPEALVKNKPHLIYTQLNAYGFSGPWAKRHGFEQLAQACTGAAAIQGGDITSPRLVPAYMNDYLTGYLAAIGTMAALLRQEQEGGAWLVNVSLARTCMMIQDQSPQDATTVKPSTLAELKPWLIDQQSPLGVLTRLKPPIEYDLTPMYVVNPASAPGSHLPLWRQDRDDGIEIPHYPTKCFEQLQQLGDMSLR